MRTRRHRCCWRPQRPVDTRAGQTSSRGCKVATVDLQGGPDPGSASMSEYADQLVQAARALPQPVSRCGWSMGGLAVLLAAGRVGPHRAILIEASPSMSL